MESSSAFWLAPIALFVVTILLLLYLVYLNYAPMRKESTSQSSSRRSKPITNVDNPVVLAPQPPQYAPPPPQYQSQPPQYQSQPPPPQYAPPPMRPPDSTELEAAGKMVILGGLEPREIPLPSAHFTVGRFYSPENNVLVALDEKSVSRKHAILRVAAQGREYYLQDVGSTYGTHLALEGRFDRLQPGVDARVYNQDVVQFGSAVQVQLVLPCETRSAITQL
jgi:pSer/pThr/pTyr-binding forkhead associated (FHA) protein